MALETYAETKWPWVRMRGRNAWLTRFISKILEILQIVRVITFESILKLKTYDDASQ